MSETERQEFLDTISIGGLVHLVTRAEHSPSRLLLPNGGEPKILAVSQPIIDYLDKMIDMTSDEVIANVRKPVIARADEMKRRANPENHYFVPNAFSASDLRKSARSSIYNDVWEYTLAFYQIER